MVSQKIILDQGNLPECSIYASLNCLEIMKPELDILAILKEMQPDFKKIMSHVAALNWLKKRGYIKDHVPYRYNPLLAHKIPVVARVYDVDWRKTGKYPYKVVPGENANANYICIIGKGIAENSWGEDWGDNGLFYFEPGDLKYFSMIRRIIV